MTSNYFSVKGQFFFFNDRDVDDAQRAFDLARAVSESLTLFRPTPSAGPWDRVPLVGHRRRADILHELAKTTDDFRRFWLRDELRHLDTAYFNVGRDTAPFSSVAAA